jgi:hypothetical protein
VENNSPNRGLQRGIGEGLLIGFASIFLEPVMNFMIK